MKPALQQELIHAFNKQHSFSRQELLRYFIGKEKEVNKGTLNWRIYHLKKNNVIQEIAQGLYTTHIKPVYMPAISERLKRIAGVFDKKFSGTDYCAWELNWINELTTHQFSKDLTLVETEKMLLESVGHALADNGMVNISLLFDGMLFNIPEPITVLPMISRSPVQSISLEKGKKIMVPTLEKILVDIFNDKNVFLFLQGAEMKRIFNFAIKHYLLNLTTLFGYASRRGKREELHSFLLDHFPEMMDNFTT